MVTATSLVNTTAEAESETWHRQVETFCQGKPGVPVNTHVVGVPLGLTACVAGFPETFCQVRKYGGVPPEIVTATGGSSPDGPLNQVEAEAEAVSGPGGGGGGGEAATTWIRLPAGS